MKCSVCGRELRNPKSYEVGYEPVCYKRLFGSNLRTGDSSSMDIPYYDIPGQMTLDDYLQTNPAE